MIAVSSSETTSVSKANRIEDYEHALVVLQDADIGDRSNLIILNDCVKS